MNFDRIAIIVAIISIVLLIILGVVLYFLKFKNIKSHKKLKHRGSESVNSRKKLSMPKEEGFIKEHQDNLRLDGARVSHRRNHPDRMEQEEMFRKTKSQEEERFMMKAEFERKHKLEMVYSPCSGGVVSFAQTKEDAINYGLNNPGVIVSPHDEFIGSPINGVVKEISKEKQHISLESNNGLQIELKLGGISTEEETDYWTQNVSDGSEVRVGDVLFKINEEYLNNKLKPITISVILDNYKQNQLVLMKNVNYVSIGDKLITVKEGLI